MSGSFEVKNWRIVFAHFLSSVMGSECAPQPQKGAHGQSQIVLVKESKKMSPQSHLSGNSRVVLKGVASKMASVS